jgi:hypothetical protein
MIELLQVLVEGQAQLAEAQQELRGMVERIITAFEALAQPPPKPPEPPLPIATYEDLYGPLPPPRPITDELPTLPPPRRHWLVRWLTKEGTA